LYLFEFYRCPPKSGTSSPYICLEWPGIQIPQTITSLLLGKGFNFPFINDPSAWDQHTIHFYERDPARRGLDFRVLEDNKHAFLKYVLDFHCHNPITDIKKHPLPQLEDLVEGVHLHTTSRLKCGAELGKELNRALR
jgi:hypothetical protein